MIHLFGNRIELPIGWEFLDSAYGSFIATLIAWLFIAFAINFIVTYPLRWFLRRLPGEIEDIILELCRVPIISILLSFGILDSLELLPLTTDARRVLERIFATILISVIVYTLWWVIKDVLVYYGGRWVRRTDSSIDDILVPALNLLGPLLVALVGAAIILPLWDIDLSSVLFGAGVVGLVLGLALQEPLSNVFSGLSLLIESPFRPGDLILFGNDKVGEVERLGLRSTRIYSIADHSTVYLPNKSLSANMLMNISKPTVEQKFSIVVTLPPHQDMARAQEELKLVAIAHPNVVTDDLGKKIVLLRERIALNQSRAGALPADDPGRRTLLGEASKYQQAIERIALEDQLNHSLLTLQEMLFDLVLAIRERERGGFSAKEVQELHAQSVAPVAQAFQRVGAQAEAWSQAIDPWIPDREQRQQRKAWSEQNQRLRQKWEHLQQHLMRPRGKTELRLDDVTIAVLDWLKKEYKVLPEVWKNPEVRFKAFTEEGTQLQLWLFVDNVRLEHYSRPQRVVTEIARQIREHLSNPVR